MMAQPVRRFNLYFKLVNDMVNQTTCFIFNKSVALKRADFAVSTAAADDWLIHRIRTEYGLGVSERRRRPWL
jgi:hypothetical protein